MDNAQRIIDDPKEVHAKLAELGLTLEIIVKAVTAGVLARRECTKSHPVTAPGYMAWSETVRTLRDQLIPLGCEANNESNQGLVSNPKKSIMLGVAPGDSNTGKKSATPSTRTARGAKTLASVAANSGYLFTEMEEDEIIRLLSNRNDLWLLLVFWDEVNDLVQLEVSRPVKANEGKRLIAWAPRILLQNLDFSDGSKVSTPEDTPSAPSSPEIVVEVKRRA